jgi:type IV secretory pathway VirB4 component
MLSKSLLGVECELVEHELTAEQIRIYDACAGAFQIIHNDLDAALRAANATDETGTLNAQAKSAARSAFESAKQRFFSQQSNALKQALQPYTVDGPWGRLLDAENERLGEAEVQAFETEGLIPAFAGTSGAAAAVLSYLFHHIEDRFDGRPTLLIIDEGWLALDDRGFAGQLCEWLKTLRKKNASGVFATQSLADIGGSKTGLRSGATALNRHPPV